MKQLWFSVRPAAALLMLLGAFGGVGSSPAWAQGVSLQSLLTPGATFRNGDKLFSDFTYTRNPDGDMPLASGITVLPLVDSSGNFGLRFQGAFLDNPGGANSDALITYRVTVTDPGRFIIDAHLAGNPVVASGNGSITVTETFVGSVPAVPDTLVISANVPGVTVNSAAAFFAAHTTLLVQKDILASSTGGIPQMSFIDQTFSQTPIPEPASLALFGLGVAGVLGYGWRRRQVAVA
jgi:hypothetical protein